MRAELPDGDIIYLKCYLLNIDRSVPASIRCIAVDFNAYMRSEELDPSIGHYTVWSSLMFRNLEMPSIVSGKMSGAEKMRNSLEVIDLRKPEDDDSVEEIQHEES